VLLAMMRHLGMILMVISMVEYVIILNAVELGWTKVMVQEIALTVTQLFIKSFNMRKKITPLIFIIILLGCKYEKSEISEVPKAVVLKGNPIPLVKIGYPFLNMLGNNLITLNKSDTNLFSVFETQNFSKIAAFGSIGNGPEEFIMPTFSTKVNESFKANDELLIHDLETNTISSIQLNIEDAIAKPKILSKKIPNTGAGYVRKVVLESDSTLIFMPENLGRLAFYDKKSGETRITPYISETHYPIVEENKWMVYQSVLSINVSKKLIAAAPLLLGELDFFDLSGKLVRKIIYDDHNHMSEELSNSNVTKSNLRLYASDIQSNESSIFLLVTDQSFTEVRNKTYNNQSRILEFDWDGNYVNQFVINNYSKSFAYDKNNQKFYIFNENDEQIPLWSYSIK
jgi:hypothetical protein